MIDLKRTRFAAAACLLITASLCLVALEAAKRPAKTRKKRPKRVNVALKVGQLAPDFELYTLEHALTLPEKPAAKATTRPKTVATTQPTTQPAEGKLRLSSFRGKRPVYLIFASYT